MGVCRKKSKGGGGKLFGRTSNQIYADKYRLLPVMDLAKGRGVSEILKEEG